MTTLRTTQYFDVDSRMEIEYFRGSDCSGADGAQNRVLTLSNTQLTTREQVFIDGLNFHSIEFTIARVLAGTTITVLRPIWDDQRIVVSYWLT